MQKITAIELENFQSIKDRTRINFSAITLLYGPNSAGKSSIFDALELIECLCQSQLDLLGQGLSALFPIHGQKFCKVICAGNHTGDCLANIRTLMIRGQHAGCPQGSMAQM